VRGGITAKSATARRPAPCALFLFSSPPIEQPLAPRPRQAPKGVRALLLKRFRNGVHDGRAGICATAASSRFAEASARCLWARSRRSGVRRTTLNESLMARQTVRCGLRALPSCAPLNRDHDREHDRKSDFCFEVGNETGNGAARLAGPPSRNIEHPLKKILLYRRCDQFTDELANPHISYPCLQC
jgi:hypothetical protein